MEREGGELEGSQRWLMVSDRKLVWAFLRGMEWLGMAWLSVSAGWKGEMAQLGSPLRQEGGYHRGERVVRKLRKATRSETTRAKQ